MGKEFIEQRIKEISELLRQLDIKLEVYSGTDQLAYAFHYEKYKTLDMECLELLTQLREVECPPDHSHLIKKDKAI
jgi:hypothetical protein